jgi:hypothetical protein
MKKKAFLLVVASSQLFAQGSGAASSTESSMQNWVFGLSGAVLAAAGMTAIVATTGSNTAH